MIEHLKDLEKVYSMSKKEDIKKDIYSILSDPYHYFLYYTEGILVFPANYLNNLEEKRIEKEYGLLDDNKIKKTEPDFNPKSKSNSWKRWWGS